jgi:hypothetical protein
MSEVATSPGPVERPIIEVPMLCLACGKPMIFGITQGKSWSIPATCSPECRKALMSRPRGPQTPKLDADGNVIARKRSSRPNKLEEFFEAISKKYLEDKVKIADIATEYSVKPFTVYSLLKSHDIKPTGLGRGRKPSKEVVEQVECECFVCGNKFTADKSKVEKSEFLCCSGDCNKKRMKKIIDLARSRQASKPFSVQPTAAVAAKGSKAKARAVAATA